MLVPLLLFLGVAASSLAPARGDSFSTPMPLVRFPITYFCTPTTDSCNPKGPNDTFDANVARLSDALPKAALASGFASGAFGAAPDTAYGLALCRGDFIGQQCVTCLEIAFSTAVSILCGHSPDVTVYYDQCQFRYSNQDFLFGRLQLPRGDRARHAQREHRQRRRVRQPRHEAPGRGGRRSQHGGRPIRHGPGRVPAGGDERAQDLTPRQCRWCLEGLIGDMPRYSFTGSVGAKIQGVRCNIRYEHLRDNPRHFDAHASD